MTIFQEDIRRTLVRFYGIAVVVQAAVMLGKPVGENGHNKKTACLQHNICFQNCFAAFCRLRCVVTSSKDQTSIGSGTDAGQKNTALTDISEKV